MKEKKTKIIEERMILVYTFFHSRQVVCKDPGLAQHSAANRVRSGMKQH